MKLFSEEAKLRHLHSRWDPTTRQVFSAEEAELEDLLADDDKMNKSDEPTLQRDNSSVEVNIAQISSLEENPELYKDDDSVSTFNPAQSRLSTQPSLSFQPRTIDLTSRNPSSVQTPVPTDINDDFNENVSKISDTESRLSSMEDKFEIFQNSLQELWIQTAKEAENNAKTLDNILKLLTQSTLFNRDISVSSVTANHPPQIRTAGGTEGSAGPGCW